MTADAYFDVGADDLDLLDDDSNLLLVAGDYDDDDDDDDDDVGYDELEELLVAGDYDDDDEDEDEVGRGFKFNVKRRPARAPARRPAPRPAPRPAARPRNRSIRLARRPLMTVPRTIARHVGRQRKLRGDKAISASTRSSGPIPAGQSKKVESIEVNYDLVVTDLLIYTGDNNMHVIHARIGEEQPMDGEFPVEVFSAKQETRPPVFGVLRSGTSASFEVLNNSADPQHFYAVLMGRRQN